jgi:hypothetical protein
MKNVLVGVVAAIGFAAVWHAVPAAQSQCLHGQGEAAEQRARRAAALRVVRALNTLEANDATVKQTKRYRSPTQLSVDFATAQGFEPHFTTDGTTYALMLTDTTDPCNFVLTTNEKGVIFQGYPVDYDVQPVKR